MIKTTVAKLMAAQDVLQKIVSASLPARECWKALRTLREIEKESGTITDARRELCKKYAVLDEQGNFKPDEEGNFMIRDEAKQDFMKEMTDFLNEELEIDCEGFGWDVLDKIEFTPAELAKIDDFIEDK